jgi:acyl carrier protein
MSTEQRVQAVIARTFNLTPDDASGELRMGNPPSWDSVGHMGLILELEDEFGVTFPTYEVANLQTASDIVRAINTYQPS